MIRRRGGHAGGPWTTLAVCAIAMATSSCGPEPPPELPVTPPANVAAEVESQRGGVAPAVAEVDAPPPEPPALDTPAPFRGTLALPQRWQRGTVSADDPRETRVLEATVTLAEHELGDGAALRFGRLWWEARVDVDGQRVGAVTGSLGPVELPLGDHLHAGANHIRVEVAPPPTDGSAPALLTGGRREQVVVEEPTLVLRPRPYLDQLVLSAGETSVAAQLTVVDAPDGARVRAAAVLDGQSLQGLGEGPVGDDGRVALSPVRWDGPRWSPTARSEDTLVHVVAELLDADGAVLDRHARRLAVRSVTVRDDALRVDGRATPLLAVRRDDTRPAHAQLAEVVAGGINALEVHGDLPGEAWFDEMDELGAPVVLMPRCDGAMWRDVYGTRAAALEHWAAPLGAQDERLVWFAAAHPAVLLWVCEGSPTEARQACRGVDRRDPVGTPIASIDLPVRSIGVRPNTPDFRDDQEAAWIAEVGWMEGDASIRDVAVEFGRLVRAGGYGGVALPPSPRAQDRSEWRDAWSDVAEVIGAPALAAAGRPRRATSRLHVRGAAPGHPVWLRAGPLPAVGAVADGRGRAVLSLWHAGDAEVSSGTTRATVTLVPDRWGSPGAEVGMSRSSRASTVHLTAADAP